MAPNVECTGAFFPLKASSTRVTCTSPQILNLMLLLLQGDLRNFSDIDNIFAQDK